MNIETPENKTSFLASRLSGFNSFLFWFGKKVYSFLLGLIFIIFIGAGFYAFFVGGDSVSVPDFGDKESEAEAIKDVAEEQKKMELEKTKLDKEFKKRLKDRTQELGRTLTEDEFNEISKEVYGEEEEEKKETRSSAKQSIDDEYGDDIKELMVANKFAESAYEMYVERILDIPKDLRDSYFYGLVDYGEDAYDYFSEDDNFKIFAKRFGWEQKWDIHNWAEREYNNLFYDEMKNSNSSESAAEVKRALALKVMGGSFLAFLIAVLIVIFIQIEANTRPENKDRT